MVLWDVVVCTLVGDTAVMNELATFVLRGEMMGEGSSEMLVQNRTSSMQKLLLICIQVTSLNLGQDIDYPG
jgi:hypothetical protein